MRTYKPIWILPALFALIIVGSSSVQAGLSVTISYDFLPYQNFKEPITPDETTVIEDGQAQLKKLRASISYPIVFSQGRTILVNELSAQQIDFSYHNLVSSLEKLHTVSYTLMLQHQLSEKWALLAIGAPSLASDLEADISRADFSVSAGAVFIRQFSERLSLGLGAAYSTQFGTAIPLPVLTLDWNNGNNLVAKAILPSSLEFWYSANKQIDLGILMFGDGNNYSLAPERYDVADPELRYTMLTIGAAAKTSLSEKVQLHIEAGVIGLHRFEFYDGNDEGPSYDLKPSQYARLGIQLTI